MDTLQIVTLLAMDLRFRSILRGVVPKDGLPTTIDDRPVAFVCDGRGDYFCSYGLPPRHAAFRIFINEHCSECVHNSKRLQSPLSKVCEQYCVAYLLLRCNCYPMRTFVNIFGTDLVANDCRVFDWLKELIQGRLYYRT